MKLHWGFITLHSPPESKLLEAKGAEFVVHLPNPSETEALHEMLKDRLHEFGRDKKSLALIRLNPSPLSENQERLDVLKETVDNVIQCISELIKKGVDEVVCLPKSRQIFLLLCADRAGVGIVLKRIQKQTNTLFKSLPSHQDTSIHWRFDVAIAPEDSTDVDVLVQKVWPNEGA